MPATRPNVIIVLTDDQGYGDLGCHGNPVARTPELDRLHSESARLVDFHAAPMCTPTRGQLLTGLDAARNGALNVSSGRTLLRRDLPTMADHFRRGGYRTGIFGKWHLGDNHPYRPEDRGFDESLWFPSSHIGSVPDHWENDYFDDVYRHNGEKERVSGYCTEVFFREATAWMGRAIDEGAPFFAYLPTNAPHSPHFVPADDLRHLEAAFSAAEQDLPALTPEIREQVVRFLAMIYNLDREIGRMREFLTERGVGDDTVLIFMTDNGSTMGHLYFDGGMRGLKTELWEGGHRVPCFIHWPAGGLDEGHDVVGLTHVQDILPTLVDWCGLDLDGLRLDGTSLDRPLRGGEELDDERMLFVNYSRMPWPDDHPIPDGNAVVRRDGTAVLWRRWRLIGETELYELDTDPMQVTDVAGDHPDVVEHLRRGLDDWWSDVAAVANEPQPTIVGSDRENPSALTSCEWWNVLADSQYHVRAGARVNSYWHLEVAHAGPYRFTLRRWPVEATLTLGDACGEAILTDGTYPAGVALPIASARIRIAGHDVAATVEPEDDAIEFDLELEAGPQLLHTWFLDEHGEPLAGAYYVEVERREPVPAEPAA